MSFLNKVSLTTQLLLITVFVQLSCQKSTVSLVSKSGKIEKGSFAKGSTVKIYTLDSKLNRLDEKSCLVDNDLGAFSNNILEGSFVDVSAKGYFYNEFTGKVSSSPLTLEGYCNPDKGLNVNILTHLEKPRVKYLVDQGKSFDEAKQTALKEILVAFFKFKRPSVLYAESLDLYSANNNDELLALSIVFLATPNPEASIEKFRADLKENGVIDDAELVNTLALSTAQVDQTTVRSNLYEYVASKGYATKNLPSNNTNLKSILKSLADQSNPTVIEAKLMAYNLDTKANVIALNNAQNQGGVMRVNSNLSSNLKDSINCLTDNLFFETWYADNIDQSNIPQLKLVGNFGHYELSSITGNNLLVSNNGDRFITYNPKGSVASKYLDDIYEVNIYPNKLSSTKDLVKVIRITIKAMSK